MTAALLSALRASVHRHRAARGLDTTERPPLPLYPDRDYERDDGYVRCDDDVMSARAASRYENWMNGECG